MEFELGGHRPKVDPDAYIAPTAVLIGEVEVGAGASVWFGAVLRADEAAIKVGPGANIQDNAVIHCAENLPTVIEKDVTIGHSAQLEGCVVEAGALVGMGATMLQRSRLGAGSMLAAGAVLGEGVEIPPGHLAAGVPAVVKKQLAGSSRNWVASSARHYKDRAVRYRADLKPIAK
ncbi:MAG TPA: gamma carbonic anhydrase family protein [Candidatus Dormibacteraeota bacterium]|jgi:carbonic anhydrase/acetyltransferase-like protein (isoleucine patch superfamily)